MSAEPIGELSAALGVRGGIVCAVGAGGKKSTLYRLAREWNARRVGITSTTLIARFPKSLGAHVIVTDEARIEPLVVRAAAQHRLVAFACAQSDKPGRLGGLEPDVVTQINDRAGFDLTLVKADGARLRSIKAPGDGEPRIPPGASLVVPVVSARVIGRLLDEDIAHRIERVSAVTDAQPGETLTPEHVARLIADQRGGTCGVAAGTVVVPVINMVDDGELEAAATAAAERALELSDRFDRVVLASLRDDQPVRRVVGRER